MAVVYPKNVWQATIHFMCATVYHHFNNQQFETLIFYNFFKKTEPSSLQLKKQLRYFNDLISWM